MIEELLKNISNGTWGPYYPIQRKDFTGGGGSSLNIRVIPFEDFAQNVCERHHIDPITLYRTAQRKIYQDMLQRVNRSSIFRDKVQGLLCEWGDDCSISDMFEDRVTDPFDHRNFMKEQEVASSLRSQLRNIETNLENEDPNLRDKLMSLQSDCSTCMGRLQGHKEQLIRNSSEYQPKFPDVWANLAMKDDSFYRQGIRQESDPEYQRFAAKQIERVIPSDINRIFGNIVGLPTLMRKENRMMVNKLDEIDGTLQEDFKKLKYLIDNLPESPEATETQGFLEGILGKIGIEFDTETPEQADQEPESGPNFASIVRDVMEPEQDDDEQEGESDEEERDEDDEDDEEEQGEQGEEKKGQTGGALYHLSFF